MCTVSPTKNCTISSAINKNFIIHGLWPNKIGGQGPFNCDNSTLDMKQLTPILGVMKETWPSCFSPEYDFWNHEYTKHGTCAVKSGLPEYSTQFLYFNTVISLTKSLNLLSVFSQAGIMPSDTKRYTTEHMANAVQNFVGYKPQIVCFNPSYFGEIRICFSKALQPIACPALRSNNACDPTGVFFPTIKYH